MHFTRLLLVLATCSMLTRFAPTLPLISRTTHGCSRTLFFTREALLHLKLKYIFFNLFIYLLQNDSDCLPFPLWCFEHGFIKLGHTFLVLNDLRDSSGHPYDKSRKIILVPADHFISRTKKSLNLDNWTSKCMVMYV